MGIEEKAPEGIILTTVAKGAEHRTEELVWPAQFGLACCAIEMMAVGGPRFDIARFGMERFSASPRQADLMIVAGRVSQKMAPVLRQISTRCPSPSGSCDGRVCQQRWDVQTTTRSCRVCRPHRAGRHVPAGLPAAAEMLLDAILNCTRRSSTSDSWPADPNRDRRRTLREAHRARHTQLEGLPVDIEIAPYANAAALPGEHS